MLTKKLKERKQEQGGAGNSTSSKAKNQNDESGSSSVEQKNPGGMPKPSPPNTRKDVLCSEENSSLFKDLEKHVGGMKANLSTFDDLMEGLYMNDLTELEKVRILFLWITAQNLETIKFSKHISVDSPLGFLKAIYDKEESYAALFLRLCSAAGLYASTITGFVKGAGYCPDHHFKDVHENFRGKWNAVLINGQWRLVDTHWGSRHVSGDEDDQGQESSENAMYKFEEHWFLTDPEIFINSHFPDEKDWQLLRYPVRLDQFEKSIKQWPLFYKLDLGQSSHQSGLIDAKGQVQVRLRVLPFARSDTKFKVELRSRNHQTSSNSEWELQKYVLHYSTADEEVFDVFPPRSDEFLLKVFGLSKQFCPDGFYNNLCIYQITCSEVNLANGSCKPPFPIVNESYGPNLTTSEFGLKPVSHTGPNVECDERGEATVVMTTSGSAEDCVFSGDLRDAESSVQENSVVHTVVESSSENRLIVYVRPPQKGNYALTLYSNMKSHDGKTLTSFCHYLISSQKLRASKTEPFPQVPNGKLGVLQPAFSKVGLMLRSCMPQNTTSYHWLEPDKHGECMFVFQHTQPLSFMVNLATHSSSFNDYALVQTDGKHTVVIARVPPALEDGKVLRLKVFAAPSDQARDIPSVYTSFIACKNANPDAQPWPQVPSRVWGVVIDKWTGLSVTSLRYLTSNTAVARRTDIDVEGFIASYITYAGGNDMEIQLQHSIPLQLKPKLTKVNPMNRTGTAFENQVIARKNTATSTVFALRLPEPGYYSLSFYGEKADVNKAQLAPIFHCLIEAESPTVCADRFPEAFALWTTSCSELRAPLIGSLKRNKPVAVKITLGCFSKNAEETYTVNPFRKVLLVIDGNTSVEPKSSSGCDYEWQYNCMGEEEKLAVAVQASATKSAVNFVLEFEMVD